MLTEVGPDYPIAFLLIGVGIVLVLTIEEVCLYFAPTHPNPHLLTPLDSTIRQTKYMYCIWCRDNTVFFKIYIFVFFIFFNLYQNM